MHEPKQRNISPHSRGYAMVAALVALLIIVTFMGLLLTAAGNLRIRTQTVSYQNSQCETVLKLVADRLTHELEDKSSPLTKHLFEQISTAQWVDYIEGSASNSLHGAPNTVRTYTVDLASSDAATDDLLKDLLYTQGASAVSRVTVEFYWEAGTPGAAYVNGDNRELVARLTCRSNEGGYYALLLRFQNHIKTYNTDPPIDYWEGDWIFLWEEKG